MNIGAVGYLQKLPLFRDIPDHVLGKLAGQLTERRLETGELLFSRGDSGNSVYIIQTGWVKISLRDSNGDELTLNECGPGEVVGELSLIDEEPRSASVSALSSVTVLELKRQVFLDILADEPHLYFDITRNIASKLRFATTYIEKMIEWSHRITAGDYDPALDQIQTEQSAISPNQSDDAARANHMLAAFFRMVEGFKRREDDLKEQLRDLSIHIDKEKRQQEFEKVTGSSFFDNLKTAAHEIRQQRYAEGKK
jgi:CRP-like cAMP-binding protein